MEMNKRPRKSYTEDFRKQMVQSYASGKASADIVRQYDLTSSALNRWKKQDHESDIIKHERELK